MKRRLAVAAVVAALFGLAWLFREAPAPTAPEPELLALNLQRLKVLRAQEDRTLASYSWVDKKAGIGRIPIERAVELMLRKGFPVRSGIPQTRSNRTARRRPPTP